MLYTRKGDTGTTKLFDCQIGQRISKSDFVFEVLGTLDELNSSLGHAIALSRKSNDFVDVNREKLSYEKIIEVFQQKLFCIQAELGGSDIHVAKEDVSYLENIISEIEALLPPIKSFIVPGGGETGTYLDVARTIARRAERGIVFLREINQRKVNDESIIFINRLSSVLYAMARFANYQEGYTEKKPKYQN